MAKSEGKKSQSSKGSRSKNEDAVAQVEDIPEESKGEPSKGGSEQSEQPVARVKFETMCRMFDDSAAQMLVYALDNPIDQQAVLAKRQELLQALYKLRYLCDCDSQFSQLDFEGEMRKIRKFRLKMQRLQEKEDVDRDSDESESSDDTEGDDDHLDIMKEARKNMAYAFGTTIDAMTARHTSGTVMGW
jgi:hypothetical protein